MSWQIGMLIGKDGMTMSLEGECRLSIVQKNIGQWREIRSLTLVIDKTHGLKRLRQSIQTIIDFLGDCRIFVGESVTGVLFYELEKIKCSVWEMSGFADDFLDEILAKEEENQHPTAAAEKRPIEPFIPKLNDLGGGRYQISIKEIQESGSGITSKQVLAPILRSCNFAELQIDCTHIPPWIECEFISGTLQGKIEKLGLNKTEVIIYRHTPEKKVR